MKKEEYNQLAKLDIKSLEIFYNLEENLFTILDKRDSGNKIKLLSMSKKFHLDSLPEEHYPWMAYNKYEFVFNSNEPLDSDEVDGLVIDTTEYLNFILKQYIKLHNDFYLNHVKVDVKRQSLFDIKI